MVHVLKSLEYLLFHVGIQVTFWILTVICENVLASDAYLAATEGYGFVFTVAGMVPALNAGIWVFFVLYKTTENV